TAVSWHPQLCFFFSCGLDLFGHSLDFLDFGSMERFCGDSTWRCFLGQFRGCGDCDAS
ncbi:hypothetical protein BDZ89DRAFT_1068655, partial [Hymenopellis radicata]